MAGDGVLLEPRDFALAHALEVVVIRIVLFDVLGAEKIVFTLLTPPHGRLEMALAGAAIPGTARLNRGLGFAFPVFCDPDLIEVFAVEFHA